MASCHTVVASMWISVELVSVLRTILRVCDERCLQTLIRLIMVAQQILQLFLLHLRAVSDRLQNVVCVLWRPQIN